MSVLVTFLTYVTKELTKNVLKTEGFLLAHKLRVQFLQVGTACLKHWFGANGSLKSAKIDYLGCFYLVMSCVFYTLNWISIFYLNNYILFFKLPGIVCINRDK